MEVNQKIIDFASSKERPEIDQYREELLEKTLLAVVIKYLNPHQYKDRMEQLLETPDFENQLLLTNEQIDAFCRDYFNKIEEWLVDIKHKSTSKFMLYKVSVNYSIGNLISLY